MPTPVPPPTLRAELLGRGLGPRTATQYARTITTAQMWMSAAGTNLADASPVLVAEYALRLPPTFASRGNLRCALRHYWDMVERDKPPLRAIRVPPQPRRHCQALDEDDARRLAKTARARGDDRGLAVALGLYQALRREEIASLPWSAVGEGWLTVHGKKDIVADIPLHPVIAEWLHALPRLDTHVFPGGVSGHISRYLVGRPSCNRPSCVLHDYLYNGF